MTADSDSSLHPTFLLLLGWAGKAYHSGKEIPIRFSVNPQPFESNIHTVTYQRTHGDMHSHTRTHGHSNTHIKSSDSAGILFLMQMEELLSTHFTQRSCVPKFKNPHRSVGVTERSRAPSLPFILCFSTYFTVLDFCPRFRCFKQIHSLTSVIEDL